jgi:cell division protein FtsL
MFSERRHGVNGYHTEALALENCIKLPKVTKALFFYFFVYIVIFVVAMIHVHRNRF